MLNGTLPVPPNVVLGHDGAGTVEWVGTEVTGVQVGDQVIASLTPVRTDVPDDQLALIGCGGVGTAVVEGARIAGAGRIIAVDPVASKREAALRFGATDTQTRAPAVPSSRSWRSSTAVASTTPSRSWACRR